MTYYLIQRVASDRGVVKCARLFCGTTELLQFTAAKYTRERRFLHYTGRCGELFLFVEVSSSETRGSPSTAAPQSPLYKRSCRHRECDQHIVELARVARISSLMYLEIHS